MTRPPRRTATLDAAQKPAQQPTPKPGSERPSDRPSERPSPTARILRPRWWWSGTARALLGLGSLGVLVAVAVRDPLPLAFAAPILVALAALIGSGAPRQVSVEAVWSDPRALEGEELELHVFVWADRPLGQVRLSLDTAGGAGWTGQRRAINQPGASLRTSWSIRAGRWGRRSDLVLRADLTSERMGRRTRVTVPLDELTVFPPPPPSGSLVVPPVLLARIGNHVARRDGDGSEFSGVRPYAPGDVVRRINWPVSVRRRDLHVNTFYAERAADLVVLLDVRALGGGALEATLDRLVRAAAATAQAYLRYADRVGVVAIGGTVRWLGPDVGTRQYYRIVETLLLTRPGEQRPAGEGVRSEEITRLPAPALPPGATAIVFSPLLDGEAVETVRELRERGHPVIVVDPLTDEPSTDRSGDAALARRIWWLNRDVLGHRLRSAGAVYLRWENDAGAGLDHPGLEPLLRATHGGGRR